MEVNKTQARFRDQIRTVKIRFGPYLAHHVVAHRKGRLRGLCEQLAAEGLFYEFLPWHHWDRLQLSMCGHVAFECRYTNLKYNINCDMDPVCQRALEAVMDMADRLEVAETIRAARLEREREQEAAAKKAREERLAKERLEAKIKLGLIQERDSENILNVTYADDIPHVKHVTDLSTIDEVSEYSSIKKISAEAISEKRKVKISADLTEPDTKSDAAADDISGSGAGSGKLKKTAMFSEPSEPSESVTPDTVHEGKKIAKFTVDASEDFDDNIGKTAKFGLTDFDEDDVIIKRSPMKFALGGEMLNKFVDESESMRRAKKSPKFSDEDEEVTSKIKKSPVFADETTSRSTRSAKFSDEDEGAAKHKMSPRFSDGEERPSKPKTSPRFSEDEERPSKPKMSPRFYDEDERPSRFKKSPRFSDEDEPRSKPKKTQKFADEIEGPTKPKKSPRFGDNDIVDPIIKTRKDGGRIKKTPRFADEEDDYSRVNKLLVYPDEEIDNSEFIYGRKFYDDMDDDITQDSATSGARQPRVMSPEEADMFFIRLKPLEPLFPQPRH